RSSTGAPQPSQGYPASTTGASGSPVYNVTATFEPVTGQQELRRRHHHHHNATQKPSPSYPEGTSAVPGSYPPSFNVTVLPTPQ
ncbi:hypothetical protein AAVH_39581, partial [Aphelenchoides avenae]